MVYYDLSHLIQSEDQNVIGPIQDDEALFLYSIVRCCRLERILEIGGLNGYSSKNFLEALSFSKNGVLYTCDLNPVPILTENHKVLIKNALDLTIDELDNKPLDLVFFDCHDIIQMEIYHKLVDNNIINDNTVLALHDTNLHYPPFNTWGVYIEDENGYAHQPVERNMVNIFKNLGYDIFSISTDSTKHTPDFPVRHGITVCKKFKVLL
uniref:Methyltransferase n=1 Tax=viral metagenome TaxID=1070528 RepID=A0A6C0B140_9ZZZZ